MEREKENIFRLVKNKNLTFIEPISDTVRILTSLKMMGEILRRAVAIGYSNDYCVFRKKQTRKTTNKYDTM